MTTRIFRDSILPKAIPTDHTDGVLAYVNGLFAWSNAEVGRFIGAGKQVIRIDVIGNAPKKASILDVERFDATPQIARTWIQQRNSYRRDATIYCSRDNLSDLFQEVGDEPFWLLAADWTGAPHRLTVPLPPNAHLAGVQYSSTPMYDVSSIIADGWHPADHKNWQPL